MNVNWGMQKTSFVIRLGEFILYSHKLPSLVFNAAYLCTPGDPLELSIPFDNYDKGIEVLIVRSYPVEYELAPIIVLPKSIRYVAAQYRRQYIDLTGDFANYMKKFTAKRRSQLNKLVKDFEKFSDGNILWIEYRHFDEIDEFYDHARNISATTYQEKLLKSGFPDSNEYRAYLKKLSKVDSVRGYILFHGEKPIAYVCCLAMGKALVYEHVGYDSAYRHLSPGNVLQYLILRKLFAEDYFNVFDFNEGEGAQKDFFSTHSILRANFFFFRKTVRNYILLRSHYFVNWLSVKLVTILDRYGLKTRIKRYIRSRS